MKITRQWVFDSTKKGACNKAQLELLGISWPPKAGWMYRIVGREISEDTAKKFVECQNMKMRRKFCPHCGKEL
jgi:hypothetical protein